MRNYSKQREVIVEVLRSTDTHPTVQWVYEKCREKLPKISLGTVYRNLTELKKDGDVRELSGTVDALKFNRFKSICISTVTTAALY